MCVSIWTNAASLAKLRLIERRPSSPTCGKRPADTLVISERDIKDGSIEIKQSKTSKKLRIAVAGELEALLYRIAKRKVRLRLRSLKLIVKEDGQVLTKGGLRGRFEDARERAAESSPTLQRRYVDSNSATYELKPAQIKRTILEMLGRHNGN